MAQPPLAQLGPRSVGPAEHRAPAPCLRDGCDLLDGHSGQPVHKPRVLRMELVPGPSLLLRFLRRALDEAGLKPSGHSREAARVGLRLLPQELGQQPVNPPSRLRGVLFFHRLQQREPRRFQSQRLPRPLLQPTQRRAQARPDPRGRGVRVRQQYRQRILG